MSPELMLFLLKKSDSLIFGAFGVDEDGDNTFEHMIYGPMCNKEEIRRSVKAFLHTVDKYDDEIVSRWGGKRIADV